MNDQYLAVLEDIDGQEVLVSLFGSKEVYELLEMIQDSSFDLVGIQSVNMFLSLHDLRKIVQSDTF